ncbi:LodA/GoxA family CTQ-dependent oxidase [Planctomicrobium piriforme]|uniref:Uncharacterized protein n=1 Tax=Planctomicrobium piriforme TaxID=1576369 RepID=A0A1I3JDY5_9PLAN|nr:LodA/GoxA family CTQ-dependent oxidase [Planctomicrobium piriforme]SFI58340.1 hypothetical protein SAMN05421753_110141 [Planctomicrobium piriforme]
MEYRIFPSIGIARIGNSPECFIGPERVSSRGVELTVTGEVEVANYKDAGFRTKKQAARFHLFERATPIDDFVPAALPHGAQVIWSVRLVNKKDGIVRHSAPPDALLPGTTLRPTANPARASRVIDSGTVSISGLNSVSAPLAGTHQGAAVKLGELRTDSNGRLLVLGGDGRSFSSPLTAINSFYNNPNWCDDVADGPVTASVALSDGTLMPVTGAWVISGPPDFAPGADSVVSLYDIIGQLAVDQGWLPDPGVTSFTKDIYPLFRRARSLRFAHGRKSLAGVVISEPNWNNISEDFTRLSQTATSELTFRMQQRGILRKIETLLSDYQLTALQENHLDRWANGTFAADWTGVPPVAALPTPAGLTQAALDGTAGQGFFPGIEGGRILTDPTIYHLTDFDFRIDQSRLQAGDVTALMALPWQADFLKCSGNWWPSQRPDIAPQANGSLKMWARIGAAESTPTHQQLVDHVMQFGMISPRVVGGVAVCVEEGRDPSI